MEELEPEARVCERGHNLAQRVVPAVRDEPVRRRIRIGVGAVLLEAERVAMRPVGIRRAQLSGHDALDREDLRDGVDLGQIRSRS